MVLPTLATASVCLVAQSPPPDAQLLRRIAEQDRLLNSYSALRYESSLSWSESELASGNRAPAGYANVTVTRSVEPVAWSYLVANNWIEGDGGPDSTREFEIIFDGNDSLKINAHQPARYVYAPGSHLLNQIVEARSGFRATSQGVFDRKGHSLSGYLAKRRFTMPDPKLASLVVSDPPKEHWLSFTEVQDCLALASYQLRDAASGALLEDRVAADHYLVQGVPWPRQVTTTIFSSDGTQRMIAYSTISNITYDNSLPPSFPVLELGRRMVDAISNVSFHVGVPPSSLVARIQDSLDGFPGSQHQSASFEDSASDPDSHRLFRVCPDTRADNTSVHAVCYALAYFGRPVDPDRVATQLGVGPLWTGSASLLAIRDVLALYGIEGESRNDFRHSGRLTTPVLAHYASGFHLVLPNGGPLGISEEAARRLSSKGFALALHATEGVPEPRVPELESGRHNFGRIPPGESVLSTHVALRIPRTCEILSVEPTSESISTTFRSARPLIGDDEGCQRLSYLVQWDASGIPAGSGPVVEAVDFLCCDGPTSHQMRCYLRVEVP